MRPYTGEYRSRPSASVGLSARRPLEHAIERVVPSVCLRRTRAVGRHQRPRRVDMPEGVRGHADAGWTQDVIDHQPTGAVQCQHGPRMRLGEIAVVNAFDIVEVALRVPHEAPRVRARRPVKRSARGGLRSSVEHDGVVHGGRSEQVPHRRRHDVGRGTGINEQRPPCCREDDGQGIGVRVAAIQVSMTASVEDQMVPAGRSRDVSTRSIGTPPIRRRRGRDAPPRRRARPARRRTRTTPRSPLRE